MKTAFIKRMIICMLLQTLFAATVCSQKYENGTRLLKGAEVLSATPLQLDYVLEQLSDTAKITTNLHEGKTHLVLNDGSGFWREWWFYMGRWRPKSKEGALPSGIEKSIQPKEGNNFSGSTLGINEGFIYNLDETPQDVGINNKTATIRVTPQSQAVMEATKQTPKGNITHNIYVSANETEQNITWVGSTPNKGARLRMDTTVIEHAQTSTGFDFWNFRSSLPDTTFYVKKRVKFDQPNTNIYIKNGDLRLTDKTGDYALSDLKSSTETDPSVPSHVKNITTANITNWNTAYNNSHTHSNKTVLDGITSTNVSNWNTVFGWGNHSVQGYLKTESDPVWTAVQGNYYTKSNLQSSGQAQVHWDNVTNKPSVGTGSVTSVGLTLPNIFTVSGSPVTTSGTITATLASQTKNYVMAAPVAANGTPAFRALQETDLPSIGWTKVTGKPTTIAAYGITDAYTMTQTRVLISDTATVLRNLIKNKTVTETDPTVPTHVKSITAANITNWNTAYTNSHTHSNKTVLDGITSTNITNWNTVFGWGNHSVQGYLKTESDPVWTAAQGNYYTKTNMLTSGQAQVHWDNIINKVTYTLPAATSSILGGIKVGSGLSITADGTLSATAGSSVTVVQDIGTSTTSVISQKGVTDLLFYGNDKARVRIGLVNNLTSPESGIYSTQVGCYSSATGNRAVSVGFQNSSGGYGSVVVGAQNSASADAAVAIGIGATADIGDAIAIGHVAQAVAFRSIAIGYGSTTKVADQLTLSLGNSDNTTYNKRIINMAAGINANDAVNMSQLDLRGKIYVQSTEPSIPTNSFAFWVNGTTFYLILRSGTTQKKVQLQ